MWRKQAASTLRASSDTLPSSTVRRENREKRKERESAKTNKSRLLQLTITVVMVALYGSLLTSVWCSKEEEEDKRVCRPTPPTCTNETTRPASRPPLVSPLHSCRLVPLVDGTCMSSVVHLRRVRLGLRAARKTLCFGLAPCRPFLRKTVSVRRFLGRAPSSPRPQRPMLGACATWLRAQLHSIAAGPVLRNARLTLWLPADFERAEWPFPCSSSSTSTALFASGSLSLSLVSHFA